MKFKAKDLVELRVSNKEEEIMTKYNLNVKGLAALEKGNWIVCKYGGRGNP